MKKKKILVVDDEQKNLAAIKRIFWEDENVSLEFADNGKTALEKVESFSPDIVLLDILMPGLDGYQVCQKIKESPRSSNVMVLLLSGKTALEDRIKGYEASADDYISKPYDVEELKAKINILLRLKGAQDELKKMNLDLENLVQKRTKELVQKEQQAIVGRMVQGIVHNLRGPFSGVKGFVYLIQMSLKDCLGPADQCSTELSSNLKTIAGYVDQCLVASNRLEDMINELLNKGRKDASKEKTVIDLNDVLRSELDFLQADMELKHKIKQTILLTENLPLIQGIHSDFSQIFSNLIQNAVHAMKTSISPKEISIVSQFDEQNIIFEFMDSGAGIEPEIQEKIFEPFFSTKEMKDDVKEGESFGTGLGLYTCAEIIRFYDGWISVSNREEGGACFTVVLPHLPVRK